MEMVPGMSQIMNMAGNKVRKRHSKTIETRASKKERRRQSKRRSTRKR